MSLAPALPAASSSVSHRPEGPWSFDQAVTDCFDDMLARSIPQYETMRRLCFELACRYRTKATTILDLGCSRGEALAQLVDRYGATNRFVGIEVSQPMLAAARQRFAGYRECGVVDIRDLDLRTDYPAERASVTLSVLTLQFTPIEYRSRIVRNVYESTLPGGAFLLVEKVLGETAATDELLVERYLDLKRANGYAEEEITRKRHALEGVLVPVSARWNEDLLFRAGFRHVECFWRYLNFAGWIAIRE